MVESYINVSAHWLQEMLAQCEATMLKRSREYDEKVLNYHRKITTGSLWWRKTVSEEQALKLAKIWGDYGGQHYRNGRNKLRTLQQMADQASRTGEKIQLSSEHMDFLHDPGCLTFIPIWW